MIAGYARAHTDQQESRYISRRQAVRALGARCRSHAPHGAQVARLSGVLLSALEEEPSIDLNLFHPGPVTEWLEFAALLHDIGYIIDMKKHHRHSERLIREAELPGFTPTEIQIVSLIARFHRKRWPEPDHKAFAGLGAGDYDAVRTLTGILRVADGLDRTHQNVVQDISLRRIAGSLEIGIHVKQPPDLEIWAAEKKSALLAEVVGVPVHIRPIDTHSHLKGS
jgi:exopolyphosphatase / guanosine-5'-triphosphate,3'-diphosphate pyrophosphatase